jgi:hypothetical protein
MANEKKVEKSDDEILELFERFNLSVPIRIPTEMLDKSFSYRWINRKDQKVLTRRLGVGWKPIKKDELPALVVKPYTIEDLNLGTHTLADGTVAIADDLVLAKIPMRFVHAYNAAKRKRNEELRKGGRRRFHQAGELLGVSTDEKD